MASSSSGALARLFRSAIAKPRLAAPPKPQPAAPPPPPPSPPRRRRHHSERLAAAIFAESDLDALVSLFKAASSSSRFRAKHRVYDVAVRRLAAAGRHAAVAEILEAQKIYATDMAREGFAARLIALYGAAAMPAAAEQTFRQLPSLHCPRSALSFNALLNAVDRQTMKTLFAAVPAEAPAIVPNAVSFNILIAADCKAGDVDGALELAEAMKRQGIPPNVVTFNTLLGGLYRHGRFSEAEEMWEKMSREGCSPDLGSFNAKVKGLVLAGRMEEAEEVVARLSASSGVQPGTATFNYLIKGHCEKGNSGRAKKVFDEMLSKGCNPNRETLEALVPRLLEEGEVELAASVCGESIRSKCRVGEELLRAVADELVCRSGYAEAESLLKLAGLDIMLKKMMPEEEEGEREGVVEEANSLP